MRLGQLAALSSIPGAVPRSRRAAGQRGPCAARPEACDDVLQTASKAASTQPQQRSSERQATATSMALGRRTALAGAASLGALAALPPVALGADGSAAVQQLTGVEADLERRLTTTDGVFWPGPLSGPYVSQVRCPQPTRRRAVYLCVGCAVQLELSQHVACPVPLTAAAYPPARSESTPVRIPSASLPSAHRAPLAA